MKRTMKVGLTAVMLAAMVGAKSASAATADMGAAQKEVQDFAPWISAIILQKLAVANGMFPMTRAATAEVENGLLAAIFARFSKLDSVPLSMVGEKVLGDHIGAAMFTAATEDGPVAFKVFYFRFGTELRIGKVEVVGHWSEIEAMALTVDLLPTPVTAMLQSKPQG